MDEEKDLSQDKTTEEVPVTLGERMFRLRGQKNMTQEDIADYLKVSRQTVSKWELDKTVPDIEKLVRLSDLYEVSLDYLLKGEIREEIEETDEEGNRTRKVIIERHIVKPEPVAKRTLLVLCMLVSGMISIGAFLFTIGLLKRSEFRANEQSQDLVIVDRIYEQYTKADIINANSGEIQHDTVWLDVPGVREYDMVFAYGDGNADELRYEYYYKTLICPALLAILMLFFFIVFVIQWTDSRRGRYGNKQEAMDSDEAGEEIHDKQNDEESADRK